MQIPEELEDIILESKEQIDSSPIHELFVSNRLRIYKAMGPLEDSKTKQVRSTLAVLTAYYSYYSISYWLVDDLKWRDDAEALKYTEILLKYAEGVIQAH